MSLVKIGEISTINIGGNMEQAKRIIEIMESAVDLEIPNKVDYESGKNWGDIH